MHKLVSLCCLSLAVLLAGCVPIYKVGDKVNDGTLLETSAVIRPAGRILALKSKPVALALSPDSKLVLVKDNGTIRLIDLVTEKELSRVQLSGGASEVGLSWFPDGKGFITTNAGSGLVIGKVDGTTLSIEKTITLPKPSVGGNSYGQGVVLDSNATSAWVALNRNNKVARIELATGNTLAISDAGVAPYAVAKSPDGQTIVATSWSSIPTKAELENTSMIGDTSDSKVVVDGRGVAVSGELTIYDPNLVVKGRVKIGRQATSVVFISNTICAISCANEGTIELVDVATTKRVAIERVRGMRSDSSTLQPSDVWFDSQTQRLFVALSGRDGVAIFKPRGNRLEQLGIVPTGGFPTASLVVGTKLVVSTSKGQGPQVNNPSPKGGFNVYQFAGTLEFVDLDSANTLSKLTKQFFANQKPISDDSKLPFEVNGGKPIEHVVYILKENRTYDQIFGDMPVGDGDPKLCTYGEEFTPNQHALAREFGLLDNYYCNGVNSADGHSWAMEGNESNYQERAQGGWTRSYPYGGDDSLAISSTGFLWNSVLASGKTFKNFGEYDSTSEAPDSSYKQIFDDRMSGANKIKFNLSISLKPLIPLSSTEFPGWNMDIPDVVRAGIFLKEFETWKASGKMPNLTIIYLPQDHTAGGTPGDPTPRACIADNDLAVGRVVEAISKSQFWGKTAIFINEDDPQAGFDHVDGHRSTCLVVSPYSRKGAVVSDFYNQTSVIRTMLHILGTKQLNENTRRSPLMVGAFQEKPDLRPFFVRRNRIPVDEVNQPKPKAKALAMAAELSKNLDLSKPDASSDDTMNRIVWLMAKGLEPYPSAYSGAHGRGLAARGLVLDGSGLSKKDLD